MAKLKRFVCYNIYGRRGRTIKAKSLKQAIKKAPKNAEKCYSHAYLKKRYGRLPEEMCIILNL